MFVFFCFVSRGSRPAQGCGGSPKARPPRCIVGCEHVKADGNLRVKTFRSPAGMPRTLSKSFWTASRRPSLVTRHWSLVTSVRAVAAATKSQVRTLHRAPSLI